MKRRSAPSPAPKKAINLALQGGGSHGAFTWGVMDRLFEDGRLDVAAISGASAGAMNAVVAAHGLHDGGPEGAREALARFWRRVSLAAQSSPIRRSLYATMTGSWSLDTSPGYLFMDLLSRVASPYDLNPLRVNPLRDLLVELVDFDKVRACERLALFLSATDVETGRGRVWRRHEITPDVVMASACLPAMFHAIEIDGRHYWDGGFVGNPVLYPFYDGSPADDIVIIQINPILKPGLPKTARDISDRVSEITFNSALLKELRAIDFVQRLLEKGRLDREHYRAVRIHMIEARKKLRPLGASSKLNAEWPFLQHLFEIGREAASKWLDRHAGNVGVRQTVDLRKMFQGEHGSRTPVPIEPVAAEHPEGE
jgi:NTE family protein